MAPSGSAGWICEYSALILTETLTFGIGRLPLAPPSSCSECGQFLASAARLSMSSR